MLSGFIFVLNAVRSEEDADRFGWFPTNPMNVICYFLDVDRILAARFSFKVIICC